MVPTRQEGREVLGRRGPSFLLRRVPPRALACWLLIFLKFVFMDSLSYVRAPGLPKETEEDCHGVPRLLLLLCAVHQMLSLLLSLYSSCPWSCLPQPLGSGGDATPCEDPRQEHGPLFKFVAGCLLMATAHDEAGCRVPLAECGRLSGLTQDMLTRGKVGFLSRRSGPYPAKEESERGAASERTPLSSATPAQDAAGQEAGVRCAPVKTNRA